MLDAATLLYSPMTFVLVIVLVVAALVHGVLGFRLYQCRLL